MDYSKAIEKLNFLLGEDLAKDALRRSFGEQAVSEMDDLYLTCKDALLQGLRPATSIGDNKMIFTQEVIKDVANDLDDFVVKAVSYELPNHIKTTFKVNAKMIAEAVRKQIPQKPIDGCQCPSCGRDWCSEGWETPYCCRCGQAIDWSDDND